MLNINFGTRLSLVARFISFLTILVLVTPAFAETEFVPPNDTVGFMAGSGNNAWDVSRGIVFRVGSTTLTIDSVGLYQDLTNINLSYEIAQVTSASGNLAPGKIVLRSGSSLVTTSGLQFVDFSISPLTLVAGNYYQISFNFTGNSNQNFFYNNADVPFSQAGLNLIDGTAQDDTGNTVMPSIRVNFVSGPGNTFLPTSIPTMNDLGMIILSSLLALGAVFALRRRRQ